jgi:hypothetical protein
MRTVANSHLLRTGRDALGRYSIAGWTPAQTLVAPLMKGIR